MDNNKKIMILSSAGFGVLALGYLGYNYIDFEDDEEESKNMYNEVDKKTIEVDKKTIEEEVKEVVDEKKKENIELTLTDAVKSSWKVFWKKEYDQDKTVEKEEENE